MSHRIALLLLTLVVPAIASAQEAEVQADPPARVARISYIKGDVSFQASDGQAPETATINRPATHGDRLLTGRGGRSELTLGIAALRLDEHTDLTISNLDEDIAQFDLNSGTVGVHVRELQARDTFEIDTPNAAVRLLEPGDYRIDIDANGAVFVSVREGRAEIDAGSGATEIREGQQARLGGTQVIANIHSLGRPDSFDDWAGDRERQLNGEQTRRYVSREVVGYEELDEYGDWRTEPEYGAVWYPTRVAIGWSPYRFGRWTWVSPWGWTWIDNEPWGFAPFHYGRWAYVHSRWCWVPGPRHYRPVYAPALVGWVGEPYGGISVSIGAGPIGWFPLGPREVYVPYRRVSPRYLRNVNVSNTVIVNNTYITNVSRNRVRDIHYANRAIPGAVTTGPRHQFDNRRPDFSRPRDGRTNRDHNFTRNNNTLRVVPGDSQGNSFSGRDNRNNNSMRRESNGDNRNGWSNRRDSRDNNRPSFVERPRTDNGVRRPSLSPQRTEDSTQDRGNSQRREWRTDSPAVTPRSDSQRNNHGYRIPDRTRDNSINRGSGSWRDSDRSDRQSRGNGAGNSGGANRAIQAPRAENRSYSRPPQESRREDRSPRVERAPRQGNGAVQMNGGGGGQREGNSGRGNRADRERNNR